MQENYQTKQVVVVIGILKLGKQIIELCHEGMIYITYPLQMMDGEVITGLRTAAVSAVAVRVCSITESIN